MCKTRRSAVRLAVQEASKSPVFIEPEHPWEEGGLTPQAVLCDDGVLKMWYIARGAGDDQSPFIAYAESADGFCWERPALHLQEFDGSTANNLLFRFGDFGLQSVFVDPVAPPEARYKAMARDSITYHEGVAGNLRWTRERKWAIRRAMTEAGYTPEQRAEKLYFVGLLKGAVSPDGKQWTFLEEPLLNVGRTGLDSHNIAAYDAEAGQYVAYLRGHQQRPPHRASHWRARSLGIGRRRVRYLAPIRKDPIDDDVYAAGYCRYPHGGLHLMFPAMYPPLDGPR